MASNLTDEQINKIAQAIAAKIAEPGGPAILGCGSASSTQYYDCSSSAYKCSASSYECGGAAEFRCGYFNCETYFRCTSLFTCYGSNYCVNSYN